MKIKLKSASEMLKFGEFLAFCCKNIKKCLVIYLIGDLGSGKTTLARGFLHGFGYSGHVKSPTFTLLEPYKVNDRMIYHFDLYRIKHPQEFIDFGGSEYFTDDNICIIEWPQYSGDYIPVADIICEINFIEKYQKQRELKLTLTF